VLVVAGNLVQPGLLLMLFDGCTRSSSLTVGNDEPGFSLFSHSRTSVYFTLCGPHLHLFVTPLHSYYQLPPWRQDLSKFWTLSRASTNAAFSLLSLLLCCRGSSERHSIASCNRYIIASLSVYNTL